jgi:hypothetical protein
MQWWQKTKQHLYPRSKRNDQIHHHLVAVTSVLETQDSVRIRLMHLTKIFKVTTTDEYISAFNSMALEYYRKRHLRSTNILPASSGANNDFRRQQTE